MTTIAIRDGIIAYDSRISDGDVSHPGLIDKVWRSTRHRILFAGYGDVAMWWTAAQHLENLPKMPWEYRRAIPEMFDMGDASGLVAITPAKIYCFEARGWYPAKDMPRFAAGTGAKAAMGAMLAGATARKAVEIAIVLDPSSGPPVRTLKIADALKAR